MRNLRLTRYRLFNVVELGRLAVMPADCKRASRAMIGN